jgi:hypothetical protein
MSFSHLLRGARVCFNFSSKFIVQGLLTKNYIFKILFLQIKTFALFKLLYLIIVDIEKKWTMPIKNWGTIYSQLYIHFEDRIMSLHT